MTIDLVHRRFGITTIAKAAGAEGEDVDARAFDFVASTADEDSYGEMVLQNWKLDRYLKNPVVLFAHNQSGILGFQHDPEHMLPVGFATDVRVESGALKARIHIVTAEANPLAERVYQGLLQGSLRAVSVGFVPGKILEEQIDGADDDQTIVKLDENELFEISIAPLPANANAVREEAAACMRSLRARARGVAAAAPPLPSSDLLTLAAARLGLPLETVRKMAAAMLGTSTKESPAMLKTKDAAPEEVAETKATAPEAPHVEVSAESPDVEASAKAPDAGDGQPEGEKATDAPVDEKDAEVDECKTDAEECRTCADACTACAKLCDDMGKSLTEDDPSAAPEIAALCKEAAEECAEANAACLEAAAACEAVASALEAATKSDEPGEVDECKAAAKAATDKLRAKRAPMSVKTIAEVIGCEPTDAAIFKSLADLCTRSAQLAALEPEVTSLRTFKSTTEQAAAEREVDWIVRAGERRSYGLGKGQSRKALLAYRKADPSGFADEYKAALDGLKAFDPIGFDKPVTVNGGEVSTSTKDGQPLRALEGSESDFDRRVKALLDHLATKGQHMLESQAIQLVALGRDRDLLSA